MRRPVAWLLVLALAIRLADIAATSGWTPVNDPADYVRHAVSIAHGHGMAPSLLPQGGPSAIRAPAFPYLLGGVFAVFGDDDTAGRVACALLGVLPVWLVGLLALELWGRREQLIATALAAVYPPLVLLSDTLLTEALALPLMLAMFLVLLRAGGAPPVPRSAAAAGALLALALLTRPALSVLLVPLVAGLWRRPRPWLVPLVALATAALVIAPWTIRNAVEFGAFVPISDVSGFQWGGTYNAQADRDQRFPAEYRLPTQVPELLPIAFNPAYDENDVGRELGRAGRRYARDHPGYVLRVLWLNSLRLLSVTHPFRDARFNYGYQGIGATRANIATAAWILVALLALAGVALRRGALGGPWWLWASIPLLVASVVWTSGDTRYRLPLEPLVLLLATAGIAALVSRDSGPVAAGSE